jgi:hypothetical protein
MVAATIAFAFKALYWGFLLLAIAVLASCLIRSLIEDASDNRRRWFHSWFRHQ